MKFNENTQIANRYTIIKLLDEGGMSFIYLATDQKLHLRKVIIKIMKTQFASNSYLIEKEAEALTQLSHPYLPKIYDFFLYDYYPVIVMEYIQGVVLAEAQAFSTTEKLQLLYELSEVLTYLHTREIPILHCDLKPNNILIDEHKNIKLIDFGISHYQLNQIEHYMTFNKIEFGTPMYMAPELLKGEMATTASDAYSFAMIALFLWGKEKLFLQHSQMSVEHFSLTHLDDIPNRLVQVLYYLLQPKPINRRYTMKQVTLTLKEMMTGDGRDNLFEVKHQNIDKIAVINLNIGAGATTIAVLLAKLCSKRYREVACIEVANKDSNLHKSYLGTKVKADKFTLGYSKVSCNNIHYYFDSDQQVNSEQIDIIKLDKMFSQLEEECIVVDLSSVANRYNVLQYLGERCTVVLVSTDDVYICADHHIFNAINNLQITSYPIIHLHNKVIEKESYSFLSEWLPIAQFVQIPLLLVNKAATSKKNKRWLEPNSKKLQTMLKMISKLKLT